MGASCCVAARDKTIQSGSANEILHRNIRYSPTWSFRWDHRGRVAGEDTSINWFSDGISRNDGSENKNESTYASEDGSPLQNYQRQRWQKSPISEGTAGQVRTLTSGNFHQVNSLFVVMLLLDWVRSVTSFSNNFITGMKTVDSLLNRIALIIIRLCRRYEIATFRSGNIDCFITNGSFS